MLFTQQTVKDLLDFFYGRFLHWWLHFSSHIFLACSSLHVLGSFFLIGNSALSVGVSVSDKGCLSFSVALR